MYAAVHKIHKASICGRRFKCNRIRTSMLRRSTIESNWQEKQRTRLRWVSKRVEIHESFKIRPEGQQRLDRERAERGCEFHSFGPATDSAPEPYTFLVRGRAGITATVIECNYSCWWKGWARSGDRPADLNRMPCGQKNRVWTGFFPQLHSSQCIECKMWFVDLCYGPSQRILSHFITNYS